MSICWPRPPCASRWYSAIITALAAAIPAIESASPNDGSVGGPSGWPVNAANPDIDSARVPNPGRSRYGPS